MEISQLYRSSRGLTGMRRTAAMTAKQVREKQCKAGQPCTKRNIIGHQVCLSAAKHLVAIHVNSLDNRILLIPHCKLMSGFGSNAEIPNQNIWLILTNLTTSSLQIRRLLVLYCKLMSGSGNRLKSNQNI